MLVNVDIFSFICVIHILFILSKRLLPDFLPNQNSSEIICVEVICVVLKQSHSYTEHYKS